MTTPTQSSGDGDPLPTRASLKAAARAAGATGAVGTAGARPSASATTAVPVSEAGEPPIDASPHTDSERRDGPESSSAPATEDENDRAASEPSSSKTEKSLAHYIGVSVSVVALIFVIAIALAAIIVPRAVGATPLAVLSSSMEPKYPIGTLVVIRPVPAADIQVGDVITYQIESGKPAVATHRVIEKGFRHDGEVQFVTRGDANNVADAEPVREVQVRGRLWYAVPYLGYVSTWLTGDTRGLIVSLAAVLLLGYGAWMVVSGVRDKRRGKASAAATS